MCIDQDQWFFLRTAAHWSLLTKRSNNFLVPAIHPRKDRIADGVVLNFKHREVFRLGSSIHASHGSQCSRDRYQQSCTRSNSEEEVRKDAFDDAMSSLAGATFPPP